MKPYYRFVIAILLVGLIILPAYLFRGTMLRQIERHRPPSSPAMADNKPDFHNFDIIFQTSQSAQSKAIQLATHSVYSHCGIIHWEQDKCMVYEAEDEVTETPVQQFIDRGKGKHYVVKRLKNADEIFSSPAVVSSMDKAFKTYLHRPYDVYFGWDDDKLYCSELVWKVYDQATGIELGELHRLKDFDLTNPVVQQKMKERYGSHLPMDEKVISPADIFNSDQLVTVKEN